MVLVGPSGSGKSTALRMIAGLEEVSSGTIRIGDRVVNDVPPRERDIAMVFQNYALYPHMTVFGNMAFALKLRGVPKDEIRQRVEEAADLLSIKELLHRKPRQLSGGQRQRVAMGRAIVREPLAFLMDEPAGSWNGARTCNPSSARPTAGSGPRHSRRARSTRRRSRSVRRRVDTRPRRSVTAPPGVDARLGSLMMVQQRVPPPLQPSLARGLHSVCSGD